MTDKTTLWLHSPHQPSGGTLNISCDERGEVAFVGSNIDLGHGGYTTIEYRIDHEKMVEAKARTSGELAILKGFKAFPDPARMPIDEMFAQMDGKTFMDQFIFFPNAHVLRVRLRGIDGGVDDISFDLAGFNSAFDQFERRCGLRSSSSAKAQHANKRSS